MYKVLLEFAKQWGILISFLGLIGIEIAPIKIKPISWILKRIGALLNKELFEKIDV